MKKSAKKVPTFAELGVKPNGSTIVDGKNKTWLQSYPPELAKTLLKNCNDMNRDDKPENTDSLASQMLKGTYESSGRQIKISVGENQIVDGQHFLKAVVKANVPMMSLTTSGFSSANMNTIDNGQNRTIANRIQIEGKRRLNPFMKDKYSPLSRVLRHFDSYDKLGEGALGKKDTLGNRKLPVDNLYEHLDNKKLMKSIENSMLEIERMGDEYADCYPGKKYTEVVKEQVAYVSFEIIKKNHGIEIARDFFNGLIFGDRESGLSKVNTYFIERRKELKAYDINYSASYYVISKVFKKWRDNEKIIEADYKLSPKEEKKRIYEDLKF